MTFSPKLITFDADDTLWNFSAMIRRGDEAVAGAIMNRLGKDFAHMNPTYLRRLQKEQLAQEDPQTVDYIRARRTAYHRVFAKAGRRDAHRLADDFIEIYKAVRDADYVFWDDTFSVLDSLKGRVALGYLTNGTTRPEQVGLARYFDVVILPETLGMRKPRPEIWLYAAEQVGCRASEIVHVGDDLEADVAGALDAGAQAVWFNPNRQANPTAITPSAEIHTLSAVCEYMIR
jgi:putative hydrolase of the HAD superfamily